MGTEIDGVNGIIKNTTSDGDITIKGNDGGSEISALILDMSDAGTATFLHDVKLGDNSKAIFGAGSDLQIYHNSSNNISFIEESGSGNLHIRGSNIIFKSQVDNDDYAKFNENGAIELYNSNAKKFETTATGATVTGDVTASGGSFLLNSTNFLQFSNNSFARLVVNDTEVLRVTSAGLGTFTDGIITSGDSRINVTNNNNQAFQIGSNDDNKEAVRIEHSDADNPQGLVIVYSGGAPDSAGGDKFIRCSDTGAERFHVDAAGDILADGVATASDERLKENIADATAKWDDIKALKVRNFTWKAEHHPKRNYKHIGFIAQEFETTFPALVREHNIHPDPIYVEADKDADGNLPEGKEIGDAKNTKNRKTIHTTAMIPILTKALQEAQTRIETLETKVAALEG